ncbi:DUF4386 family protein [Piscinibacterium candidicorallinum]|uniref:DUF4386 family protein n=1 Tax=Piscinibacterium candidicorallinum TaxID=1793872 RepID=A0ABV7H7M0_9BURK
MSSLPILSIRPAAVAASPATDTPAASAARPLTTARRLGAWALLLFPLIVQVPFGILSASFHYPEVLRAPAADALRTFYGAGPGLVWVWYAYAMSIGVFAFGLLALDRDDPRMRTATLVGLASALVQWIALARWTFLVPMLARLHAFASPADAAGIEQLFAAQHQLLGVGLGEHLGQMLMAAWTILMVRAVAQPAWLKAAGWLAATLFMVGLSEQLGTAIGFGVGPLAHAPMAAFIVWSLWLMGLGVRLLRRG